MTKQTKKVLEGRADESFKFAMDLFHTMMDSELYKNGRNNVLFPFDVMMGIAEFTTLVLKVLCASSVAGDALKDSYMEDILPTLLNAPSPLDERISTLKEMLNVQPDLN